jgi:hypothetical protein
MFVKQLIILLRKANGFWKAKVRRNQLWNRIYFHRGNINKMDIYINTKFCSCLQS